MSTLKALISTYGKQPDPAKPIEVSYYYLAHEIAECHTGMSIVFADADWKTYAELTISEFAKWIMSIASGAELRRYRKHRAAKKPKPKRKFTGSRHVATQTLLLAQNDGFTGLIVLNRSAWLSVI